MQRPVLQGMSRMQRHGLPHPGARPRRQGYRRHHAAQLSEVAGGVHQHGHHLRKCAHRHHLHSVRAEVCRPHLCRPRGGHEAPLWG